MMTFQIAFGVFAGMVMFHSWREVVTEAERPQDHLLDKKQGFLMGLASLIVVGLWLVGLYYLILWAQDIVTGLL